MRKSTNGKLGLVLLSIIVAFFMTVIQANADERTGVTDDLIKIGYFGSLTGPTYIFGVPQYNGSDLLFNSVNAAGGIHGRKITTVREDDMGKPEGAIAAAKKLIHQWNVFMIHGGSASNAAIAAREEITKENVPWLIGSATADRVIEPTHPYAFRATLGAKTEGRSQVDFTLSNPAVKKVAIVAQHDNWGMAKYEPALARMKELGLEFVANEEMTVDTNDATPQVLRIRKAQADAVLLTLYPKPAAIFIRDCLKFGYKPMCVLQTGVTDLLHLQDEIGIPGSLENVFTISHTRYGVSDPAVANWAKLLDQNYPGQKLSVYNLVGIGTGQVIVEALKRAGRDLNRKSFRDAMESLNNFETDTLTGPITFTPTDHQGLKNVAWIQLRDGKEVIVGTTYPAKK
jgi:branched-chain amino acid transport system substrate-binding protein